MLGFLYLFKNKLEKNILDFNDEYFKISVQSLVPFYIFTKYDMKKIKNKKLSAYSQGHSTYCIEAMKCSLHAVVTQLWFDGA